VHQQIENKFKAWREHRLETMRPISARYASLLIEKYAQSAGISQKQAAAKLKEWGLDDLIVPPPWSPEVIKAPAELKDFLLRLWVRRDGEAGWV